MSAENSGEASEDDDGSIVDENPFDVETKTWKVLLGGFLTLVAPFLCGAVFIWKGKLENLLGVGKAEETSGGQSSLTVLATLASPVLVLLGLITPLSGPCFLDTFEPPVGLWQAFHRSFGKMKIFVLEILLYAVGFYFNLATEWDVLVNFWAMTSRRFFYMKVGLLVLSAIWDGAVAFRDFPVPFFQLRVALAIIACSRLLPACLFLLGLFLFINNPSAEWLAFGLTPFRKLSASASFMAVFTLALPSMQIELFALLSGAPLEDRGEVLLSSLTSLLSAAWGFASIDSKGKAFRHVSGIPTVIGTADIFSVELLLVVLFRLCSLGSRVLIFPFLFAYKGALAGLVFVIVDLLAQLELVWRATRSLGKLPFAVANIFSATEPLLIQQGPTLTVSIKHWLIVQFAEFVAIAAVCFLDPVLTCKARQEEPMLTSVFAVCSVAQWPVIFAVRACCTYEFDEQDAEPVVSAMDDAGKLKMARTGLTTATSHMHRTADAADARSPIGLARHVWWPSLRSQSGTWNGSLQGFGDRGVRVVSKLLREDPLCKSLWLEMNAIGDLGAMSLAEALKDIDTLEWLDLNMNHITDVGAKALADALQQWPGRCGRFRKLWLKQNRITDPQSRATLADLVDELEMDGAEQDGENENHEDTSEDGESATS